MVNVCVLTDAENKKNIFGTFFNFSLQTDHKASLCLISLLQALSLFCYTLVTWQGFKWLLIAPIDRVFDIFLFK